MERPKAAISTELLARPALEAEGGSCRRHEADESLPGQRSAAAGNTAKCGGMPSQRLVKIDLMHPSRWPKGARDASVSFQG